jgi:hypothetical protein
VDGVWRYVGSGPGLGFDFLSARFNAREKNNPFTFFRACSAALRFAAARFAYLLRCAVIVTQLFFLVSQWFLSYCGVIAFAVLVWAAVLFAGPAGPICYALCYLIALVFLSG